MWKTLAAIILLCSSTRADDVEAALTKPLLAARQTMIETQIWLASRVPAPAVPRDPAAWDAQSAQLRRQVLDNVVFRGEAARWRTLPSKPEWLDVLPGDGYRVRKFRYQVLPGLWIPGLLYEPARLSARMPVVVNVNGHEGEGVSIPYIQQRCIHLARSGILAWNFEWYSKGQMSGRGYDHARLNQIDLTGSSGLAPFFLAHQRLLDIALQHPNADPARVAVTGLSGGGWQTILLSSLDPRVKLVVPVAGYSSFVTRAQFPEKDLGDSEQTPVDLARYADYTHLTAMLAPRPTLLTHNAFDNCCFRADYAVAPLLSAARPFFSLYRQESRLHYHANFDEGHNYGLDNRQALYGMLRQYFFPAGGGPSDEEAPADLRTAEQLRMPLPDGNLDFHTLALKLAENLPRPNARPAAEQRKQLREILRWPEYKVTANRSGRLSLDGIWTVPAVEFDTPGAKGTTLLFGDGGRATLAAQVSRLTAAGQRVVAIDPFYFGESRIETRDYLFALLASGVGQRPLGIQAGQVAAVARWLKAKSGPVTLEAHGPRTSLVALAAAAVEADAIAGVKMIGGMGSLKDPIENDLAVMDAPELFCFGLLEAFDLPQLTALVKPRPVEAERARVLAAMQEVMGPMKPRSLAPLDVQVVEETATQNYTLRRLTFAGGDGDRVSAYLLLPRNVKGRVPAMLCLHQTTAIGKGEPANVGGKANLHYAAELASRGYIALVPDYPGYGDYKIDPYAMGYASASLKGIRNHMRAVDLLAALPQVDPKRIGVIGHSLGGHNSLFVAAFDPRIAAVVTSCGFTSFRKYYGGDLTGWSHRGYMPRIADVYGKSPARMPFDFDGVLAAIAPRPIFVNAPLRDANFDASGVDDSVAAARARGAQVIVVHPDAEHDFPPDERLAAYAFLDGVLKRK